MRIDYSCLSQPTLFPELGPDAEQRAALRQLELERRYNESITEPAGCRHAGPHGMLCLDGYDGPAPSRLIGFDHRPPAGDLSDAAVHGFLNDNKIAQLERNLPSYLTAWRRYRLVIAPAPTLCLHWGLADALRAVHRCRLLALRIARAGFAVVPTVLMGNAEFIDTCAFDGLPRDSWLAVEHICDPRQPARRRLFRYGVERLVERLRPRGLMVYGRPLRFEPGVPVAHYPWRFPVKDVA